MPCLHRCEVTWGDVKVDWTLLWILGDVPPLIQGSVVADGWLEPPAAVTTVT